LGWTSRVRPAAMLCVAGALALGGCASKPLAPFSEAAPPAALVTIEAAGIRDLRADYRAAVCSRLPDGLPACDDVLLRLPGEAPPAAPKPAAGGLAKRYRIAFVPGFFSECFDRFARPFADAQRALEAEGFEVDYVRVPGRGTSAANAKRLADRILALDTDPRPIIVFAHSKGLPDTLEMLVNHSQAAARVAAVVSFAGAANGSPLADDLLGAYRELAATFPLPGCDAGTGDEMHDLRRDVRLEWWRRYRDQVTVPVFALVAAPRPDKVSPGTRSTYNRLALVDPRNDGKLLWQDQLVAGGYLLGYANADHWAIAIPVSEALPYVSFMFRDGAPRPAFVRAAVEVVAATLRARHPE